MGNTQTAILRPTALVETEGTGWSLTTVSRVNDNSDATWAECTFAASATKRRIVYDMADAPALPAGAAIKTVQVFIRTSATATAGAPTHLSLAFGVSPVNVSYGRTQTPVIETHQLALNKPVGSLDPWDVNNFNSAVLTVLVSSDNGAAGNVTFKIYDAWCIIEYNTPPTVNITSPTAGSTVSSSRPAYSLTKVDAQGDSITKEWAKVFSAAQYGTAGFNPETSLATWDSGEYNYAAIRVVGTDLTNGTYRLYIKARDADYASGNYGAWSNVQFTVENVPPPIPAIASTANAPSNRVDLSITQPFPNLLTANQSSLEENTTSGWVGSGCTLTTDNATTGMHGLRSLRMTPTAAAAMLAQTTPSGVNATPVLPSTQYTALATVRAAVSGITRNCTVGITWFTSAGAVISESTGAAQALASPSNVLLTCTVVSPSNAAFAVVNIRVSTTATSEVYLADKISLHQGNSTTWSLGGYSGTLVVQIQRSADNGVTWWDVRGAETAPGSGTTATALSDYEMPYNVDLIYRARSGGYSSGVWTTSAWTASTSAVQLMSTDYWLKDPVDGDAGMVLSVMTWRTKIDEQQAVYHALGRKFPVVVTDKAGGIDGFIRYSVTNNVDLEKIRVLKQAGRALLLQTPLNNGEQYYIRMVGDRTAELLVGDVTNPYWVGEFSYVEVDMP